MSQSAISTRLIQLLFAHDERRGQEEDVSGVEDDREKALVEAALAQLVAGGDRVEVAPRRTVRDDLEAGEEAAAARVPVEQVVREPAQSREQALAEGLGTFPQPVALQARKDGAGTRRRHWMPRVRVAVAEHRLLDEDIGDVRCDETRRDRSVARAQSLGDRDEVGPDPGELGGEEPAGAPHAGDHLVAD